MQSLSRYEHRRADLTAEDGRKAPGKNAGWFDEPEHSLLITSTNQPHSRRSKIKLWRTHQNVNVVRAFSNL